MSTRCDNCGEYLGKTTREVIRGVTFLNVRFRDDEDKIYDEFDFCNVDCKSEFIHDNKINAEEKG